MVKNWINTGGIELGEYNWEECKLAYFLHDIAFMWVQSFSRCWHKSKGLVCWLGRVSVTVLHPGAELVTANQIRQFIGISCGRRTIY